MGLAPLSQVDRGVAIAVGDMPAPAGEHPIGQRQIAAEGTAVSAEPAGRIPAIGDNEFAAPPGLLVL
jgi:hypothetical protein